MNEEIEKFKNEINSVIDLERIKFEIDVFDRLGNQTTKLINNTDESLYVKGRNSKYTIYFKEPIFVQSIFVDVAGYATTDTFKFEFNSIHSNKKKTIRENRDNDKDKYSVFINNVLQTFSFTPPKKFLKDPKIKSIRIYGLSWEQFDETCSKLLNIETEKKECD